MQENKLIKYNGGSLQKVKNVIDVTNKLLSVLDPQLIPYRKKDKWGFCTADKKIVINCIYDDVLPFDDLVARVCLNNKWGLINNKGMNIVPNIYCYIINFCEGVAIVKPEFNSNYRFINKLGNFISPLVYRNAVSFNEGLAAVQLEEKWGYINNFGEVVIPFIYNDQSRSTEDIDIGLHRKDYTFYEGFAKVTKGVDKGFSYINKMGELITKIKYEWGHSFSEGLAAVYLNNKLSYINHSGVENIPYLFDYGGSFFEGLAAVCLNDKWGYIDKSANQIIPLIYQHAMSFSEGLAAVCLNDKWGYIDASGNVVVPFLFTGLWTLYDYINFANPFHEGLAGVIFKSKAGFINNLGEQVIANKYIWVGPFCNGIAKVCLHGDYSKPNTCYINKEGIEYYQD